MAEVLKVELQDENGNIYYLKTDSNSVYFEDGENLETKFGNVLTKVGDASNLTTTFTEASGRSNIASGEKTSTIFGKIKKYFTDLKPHAFKELSTNLTDYDSSVAAASTLTKTLKDQVNERAVIGSNVRFQTVYLGGQLNKAGIFSGDSSEDVNFDYIDENGKLVSISLTTIRNSINSKINTSNIVNNATTNDSAKVASAAVAKSLQDQITNHHTYSETTSTAASGITFVINNLEKVGKTVFFNAYLESIQLPATWESTLICTLPSGYIPKKEKWFTISLNSNTGGVAVKILKTGKVYIQNIGTYTGTTGYFGFLVSYIIS